MTEPVLVLCGEPSPVQGLEPCCRDMEDGKHRDEGGHCWWFQVPWDGGCAVTIYELRPDGLVEKRAHATFTGTVDAELVCALLAMLELAAEREEPDDEAR